jgi:hypothetical protein
MLDKTNSFKNEAEYSLPMDIPLFESRWVGPQNPDPNTNKGRKLFFETLMLVFSARSARGGRDDGRAEAANQ